MSPSGTLETPPPERPARFSRAVLLPCGRRTGCGPTRSCDPKRTARARNCAMFKNPFEEQKMTLGRGPAVCAPWCASSKQTGPTGPLSRVFYQGRFLGLAQSINRPINQSSNAVLSYIARCNITNSISYGVGVDEMNQVLTLS